VARPGGRPQRQIEDRAGAGVKLIVSDKVDIVLEGDTMFCGIEGVPVCVPVAVQGGINANEGLNGELSSVAALGYMGKVEGIGLGIAGGHKSSLTASYTEGLSPDITNYGFFTIQAGPFSFEIKKRSKN